MEKKNTKALFGITERNGKSYWTRIGVAVENRDGSFNLIFNFLPSDPQTRLQMRDIDQDVREPAAS